MAVTQSLLQHWAPVHCKKSMILQSVTFAISNVLKEDSDHSLTVLVWYNTWALSRCLYCLQWSFLTQLPRWMLSNPMPQTSLLKTTKLQRKFRSKSCVPKWPFVLKERQSFETLQLSFGKHTGGVINPNPGMLLLRAITNNANICCEVHRG